MSVWEVYEYGYDHYLRISVHLSKINAYKAMIKAKQQKAFNCLYEDGGYMRKFYCKTHEDIYVCRIDVKD